MSEKIILECVSYREDGKFVENETDTELTPKEVIKVVQEIWEDMPADYYSWDLKPVKDSD